MPLGSTAGLVALTAMETPGDSDFDLRDIYDDETLWMIDTAGDSPMIPGSVRPGSSRARTRRGLRSGAASLALSTALVTGVREVLEPEGEEVWEDVDNGVLGTPDEFVQLFFVPNNPRATVAIVRPWLAPVRGAVA